MTSRSVIFAIITFIIGLMIAVQIQTMRQPLKRETTDSIEIRKKIDFEKKHQHQLLSDIRNYEQLLSDYKQGDKKESEEALEKTWMQLKEKAGETDVTGKGLTITLQPLFSKEMLGEEQVTLSPSLLSELLNQVYVYGASAIAVGNERMISTSSIREVNKKLYVNQTDIGDLPVTITIVSKDPERLWNKLLATDLADYFAVDNVELVVSDIQDVTVPKYTKPLKVEYLK
ncbi:DUF881 domain-containing protein [Massilibacterium senegalense]|uniref:DUF881 domain-containing protein n=1 Tax=Massilibacterium senegalense TaxID=1632858 RepID=UPI000782072E|nr:DUF881 domain-containing protein [Massilibacterium senegalense]